MSLVRSLTLERFTGEGGVSLVTLKIQTSAVELNALMTPEEFGSLRALRAANWNERRSLRAGTSASASVYWCYDSEAVTVLIGADDESWDIEIALPTSFVTDLVRSADEASTRLGW